MAAALIRVFIENGCRTNRNKARLKYLVDDWGVEKLLEEAQKKLTFDLHYYDLSKCEESQPTVAMAGNAPRSLAKMSRR